MSVLQPPFQKLGWHSLPNETPDTQILRRTIIRELGTLGDAAIIAEARSRFAAFLTDHQSISPDDQGVILPIVAQYADAGTFDQLHAVARGAKDETEMRRYYAALMMVRDPALAQQAAQIAMSSEIPPQADSLRLQLVLQLSRVHAQLSWQLFRENSDRLMAAFVMNAPLIIAQYIPQTYWNQIPLPELETWVRAHVPAEMSEDVERGMESARFRLDVKARLVNAADAYLEGRHLQGAQLKGPQTQGLALEGAQRQGPQLEGAQRQIPQLAGAQLQIPHLQVAQLQAAQLQPPQPKAAQRQRDQLQGVD
jgi:aminopeptidase N